jgi:leucyl/phenylalanyl-tRNA---protein transferase
MPVYRIPEREVFPDPNLADESGLLGVGGDLQPRRVLLAYRYGIFPWFSRGQPILWWSPDPRVVLFPEELHLQRSLKKRIRRGDYEVRLDTDFRGVIEGCAEGPRPGQDGTWITDEMRIAYVRLHELGFAHSAEAYRDGVLVGGLYGVSIGKLFAGESMFARASDASKVAFAYLTLQLRRWGFPLIDCQLHTKHMERFGAKEIPRREYLERLDELAEQEGRKGKWSFDEDFDVTTKI